MYFDRPLPSHLPTLLSGRTVDEWLDFQDQHEARVSGRTGRMASKRTYVKSSCRRKVSKLVTLATHDRKKCALKSVSKQA